MLPAFHSVHTHSTYTIFADRLPHNPPNPRALPKPASSPMRSAPPHCACHPHHPQVLSYDLTVPTTFCFLARFKKAAAVEDARATQFAEYLVELALVDYAMLKHPLSLISAAALHAGLAAVDAEDTYPRPLRRHTRYELREVAPVARALLALAEKAAGSSLKAVYKKYSSTKFGEVAKLELPVLEETAQ